MVEIRLSNGTVAFVDDEDADLAAHRWGPVCGYVRRIVKRKRIRLHRVIAERMGLDIADKEVDHRNGDKLDNRRVNLRAATRTENQCNRGKQRNNTSGFKGVSRKRGMSRWAAQIQVNRKGIHLGYFATAEEAHAAYCRAAEELHGEFARAA